MVLSSIVFIMQQMFCASIKHLPAFRAICRRDFVF